MNPEPPGVGGRTPVKCTVVWRPTIKGTNDTKVDVLPLLFPHLARSDGSVDEAKLANVFCHLDGDAQTGVSNLPQLILDVRGTKTVFTIGSLCLERGGACAQTHDLGWKLLDAGAYAGVSILELQPDDDAQPNLQWRAVATEHRLSALEDRERGVRVLAHLQRLFARDAVFDFIANDTNLAPAWAAATESAAQGEDPAPMSTLFDTAVERLNHRIGAGEHTLRTPVASDADGAPTVTARDYVRTAIQRSARNVVVLHALGLVHRALAAEDDNLNAAWQVVDLDQLETTTATNPRDHDNVRELTDNLEVTIENLTRYAPDVAPFTGEARERLLQAIDREAPLFGATLPDRG